MRTAFSKASGFLRRSTSCVLMGGLACAAFIQPASAQRHEHGGVLQNCATTFADPSMYQWVGFRNSCEFPISVSFVGADGSHIGTVQVAAGGKQSTGLLSREWDGAGGIFFAVCHAGYFAILSNGRPWRSANDDFLCQRS